MFFVWLSCYLFYISAAFCEDYKIQITSDSPTATGIPVTFNVTLMVDGKIAPIKKYQFRYIFENNEQVRGFSVCLYSELTSCFTECLVQRTQCSLYGEDRLPGSQALSNRVCRRELSQRDLTSYSF